ncbi:MAG: CYTH domain-containing protein [Lachnospiraceae bacterium]|nr:CYTH domain-containing protein [Lachnospiraceae bacterium]
MEIEKKFLIKKYPENLRLYPCVEIEQVYVLTDPVIRARRRDDEYILTIKGQGMMVREEHELPLNDEGYYKLLKKAEGNVISKTRYMIPDDNGYTIELDIFHDAFDGLVIAEVEFPNVESAEGYTPPEWFLREVTTDRRFHNSNLCSMKKEEITEMINEVGTVKEV